MLNKLISDNPQIFNDLNGRKVMLNKSLLSLDDVSILEKEAGINFLYNMRPLNDRIKEEEIVKLINLLGIK